MRCPWDAALDSEHALFESVNEGDVSRHGTLSIIFRLASCKCGHLSCRASKLPKLPSVGPSNLHWVLQACLHSRQRMQHLTGHVGERLQSGGPHAEAGPPPRGHRAAENPTRSGARAGGGRPREAAQRPSRDAAGSKGHHEQRRGPQHQHPQARPHPVTCRHRTHIIAQLGTVRLSVGQSSPGMSTRLVASASCPRASVTVTDRHCWTA